MRGISLPLGIRTLDWRKWESQILLAIAWLTIVGYSSLAGYLTATLNGEFLTIVAVLAGLGIGILSFASPRHSFFVLLILTLGTEQNPREYDWTHGLRYLSNLNSISPNLSAFSFSLLELHLVLLILATMGMALFSHKPRRKIIAPSPLIMYGLVLVGSLIYGLSRGGEVTPAFWEVRGIAYLLILTAIVPQILRNERDIRIIVWIIILCLVSRSIEVSHHYIDAGWSIGTGNGWGNHEDPGFLTAIFVFLIALFLFKAYPNLRYTLLCLVPLFVLAIIASDRRTVYAVFAAAMIVFFLMLSSDIQKKFLRWGWKFGILLVIYLGVFWNSSHQLATPARLVRASFAEDEGAAGDRYVSNLYRKTEDFNLSMMTRNQPLMGSGTGTRLTFHMPIPIQFDLGIFIPHNQILGVFAKTGTIGFLFFIFFYLSAQTEVANIFRRTSNPFMKALLVWVMAAIMNHLVYSYFDIQLSYYRNNILLGTLLGIASVISALQPEDSLTEKISAEKNTDDSLHWVVDNHSETTSSKS